MLTLNTIIESLKAYEEIIADGQALVDFYAQGNCFIFDLPPYAGGAAMHAYPGIHEDKLKFFVIPAEYDNADTEHIAHYVTMHPIIWNLKNNRIPNHEARVIIDRWGNDYSTWIPAQVNHTSYGMFRAFAIPMSDFEIEQTQVNLALKHDEDDPALFKADIVVTNVESSAVYYDDYATPVPPYKASVLSTSFYLLSLV